MELEFCSQRVDQAALDTYPVLMRMLDRENELRLSESVNSAIRTYGHSAYGDIMDAVQRHVAEEFGYGDDVDRGVSFMRCAESIYAGDAERLREIREVSYYRKYNRCKDGDVVVGEPYPPLPPLFECADSLQRVDIFDAYYISPGKKPLVLLAGSYS